MPSARPLFPLLFVLACLGSRPVSAAPEDWRDLFIYQLLTDRFADGDPSNNNAEGAYLPQYATAVHGGDFAGIEEKLAYIRGLGANAIWLSPVVLNAYGRYHGYHILDFSSISRQFGGIEDLRSLIDAAHAAEMYIVADVVVNHLADLTFSRTPGWDEYQSPSDYVLEWKREEVQPGAPFDRLDWLHNYGRIGNYQDPEQILGELSGLDDLQTENAEVRAALVEVHAWLIEELGVDLFRVDTVKHVELEFWQEWPAAIRARAAAAGLGEFLLFGEVLDGSDWKCGLYTGTMAGGAYALDTVLAYPLYFTIQDVFVWGQGTGKIVDRWNQLGSYDPDARESLVTFIDNHDQPRFLSSERAAGRQARLRTALGFLLSARGIPTLYYGTEQGFGGGRDPDNREDFFDGLFESGPSLGDNFDPAAPLYTWIRRLAMARAAHPALRRGTTTVLTQTPSGRGPLAFRRSVAGDDVLVLLNTSPSVRSSGTMPTPFGSRTAVFDLLGGASPVDTTASDGTLNLALAPDAVLLLAAAPDTAAPWLAATGPDHDQATRALDQRLEWIFDTAMDPASVTQAMRIEPEVPGEWVWIAPNHLLRQPSAPLVAGATYAATIDTSARAAVGKRRFLVPCTTHWRAGDGGYAAPPAVEVAEGYGAQTLISALLREPTALIADADGEILVADAGGIHRYDASGAPLGLLVADPLLAPVSALAWDEGEVFGGGLLAMGPEGLVRVTTTGELALVAASPTLPNGLVPLAVATDGAIFSSSPAENRIWRLNETGYASFAEGIAAPLGLAPAGGSFGGILLVADAALSSWNRAWDGRGRVLALDAQGRSSLVAGSRPTLAGAGALWRDKSGDFAGDLIVADLQTEALLRIDSIGRESVLATGFGNLFGPGCLTQNPAGELLVLDAGSSQRLTARRQSASPPRLVRIVAGGVGVGDAGVRIPAAGLTLETIAPNPMNPSTRVGFRLDRGGPLQLSIYGLDGRLVRRLLNDLLPAGNHARTWDGRNDRGEAVASGLYLVELRAGSERIRAKVVVLK